MSANFEEYSTLLGAAIQGIGLARLSAPVVKQAIDQGRLEAVLTSFAVTTPGVFLYYPGKRQVLPKLRAFIEHIKEQSAERGARKQRCRILHRAQLWAPRTLKPNLGKLVEKHIDGGDFAVAGDEKIGPGVLGRLAWRAGHPSDPTRIADLLRRRERLIAIVGMSGLDLAGDAVDFVAAAMRTAVRVVEHTVLVPNLVDRLPPAYRIDLGEHVTKVAKQQGRYTVRHDTPFPLATDSDIRYP